MSREWHQYEYVCAQTLWEWIDTESQKLEMLMQNDSVESSELCKLLILGRKEMLDSIAGMVHENAIQLKLLLSERFNLNVKEELLEGE